MIRNCPHCGKPLSAGLGEDMTNKILEARELLLSAKPAGETATQISQWRSACNLWLWGHPYAECPEKPALRAMPGLRITMLRGEQAYRARASGLKWAQIAFELGYTQSGGKGSAHTLARDWAARHGKPWPPEVLS